MAADPRPHSLGRRSLFWSSLPVLFLPLEDALRCGGGGGCRRLLSAWAHSSASLAGRVGPASGI